MWLRFTCTEPRLGRAVRAVFAALLFGVAAVCLNPSPAWAANPFERLIMPGPVIEGHAKLEQECEQCHEPFSQKRQAQLCRECHKEVAADITLGEGYHGRKKGIAETECKVCHTEHIGRGADVVKLDLETFDHTATDFKLIGAHRGGECIGCHKPGVKHRKASSECFDCHRQDDSHNRKLGEKCGDCHEPANWQKTRFDHGKATKFSLDGKHRKTACAACHPNQRYKNTPKNCFACHKLDDAHGRLFGDKCEKCHQPDGWKTKAKFDHNKDTKFPLAGRHAKAPCATCHKEPPEVKKPDKTCIGCHRADDIHKGRTGPKCEDCHDAAGWTKTRFDHAKDTKFPLKGQHAKQQCDACHAGDIKEQKLDKACISCHRADDSHRGAMASDCARCHNPVKWKDAKFDHQKDTKFPLRGRHADAVCAACHHRPVEKEIKLDKNCYSCHAKNDVHKGQQGKACSRCHNERGWREKVFFDHDLTKFPLIGQHVVVPCEECHLTAQYQDAEPACVSCHRGDDSHKKHLGQRCGDCHNPNGWTLWRFDHNTRTDFAIDGSHAGVQCVACHTEPVDGRINMSTACFTCHRKDDRHRGAFGRLCERCHVTKSFKEINVIRR